MIKMLVAHQSEQAEGRPVPSKKSKQNQAVKINKRNRQERMHERKSQANPQRVGERRQPRSRNQKEKPVTRDDNECRRKSSNKQVYSISMTYKILMPNRSWVPPRNYFSSKRSPTRFEKCYRKATSLNLRSRWAHKH